MSIKGIHFTVINVRVAGGTGVALIVKTLKNMSQAFVRESDEQWLHEVPPTLNALAVYLSRENNGVPVYLKKTSFSSKGRELHLMSNGLNYSLDKEGKWEIVW